MKSKTKSKSRNLKEGPERQPSRETADNRNLKTRISSERKYESRGYYSRNGSYSGYSGL